jgi:hypothetical protein
MDNKKFVGFYIIGAANKEDAQKGAGLLLWSQLKPNWLVRFLDKNLLNIYWIDKEDYKPVAKETVAEKTKLEFPKHRTYRKKKADETR